MGYAKITNLYKCQDIQLFRECWAMEKIHGSSGSITVSLSDSGELVTSYLTGGASHVLVEQIFNATELSKAEVVKEILASQNAKELTVYGELYGGSMQKMAHRYGPTLKFVGFDVEFTSSAGKSYFLNIPDAEKICLQVGIEFIHYVRSATDTDTLNALRDEPSVQAKRNGIEGDQPREGIVCRPLVEMLDSFGERVVAKHKQDSERETKAPRVVGEKLAVLEEAQAVADEWVTETRLQHVLDKLPQGIGIDKTVDVIKAMTNDILVEGAGEFVDSKDVRSAVSKKTAALFKEKVLKAFLR